MLPALTTDRLHLRAPHEGDWPDALAFLTGPRAGFFGAPKSEAEARAVFDAQLAHWDKGYGAYLVEARDGPRAIGMVGVSQPEGLDEPELTWSIWHECDEGRGFAFEAASAARRAFLTARIAGSVVSYIDPRNIRSVRLAQRLGARHDTAAAPFDDGITWRHPAPAELGLFPVLRTPRLTLRLQEERDFDAFADFVAQARSKWVGGPGSRALAREGFDGNLGHWASHGFGYFTVELTATGKAIGRVGLRQSGDRPEPEVAYALYAAADESHGYASEAVRAVRDWAYDSLKLKTVVSYIDPANAASIALATRVGAHLDPDAAGWAKHPDLAVYRHLDPEHRQ